MTTIAYDGDILASDGYATDGMVVVSTNYKKIRKLPDGRYFACSGSTSELEEAYRWFSGQLEEQPDLDKDSISILIVSEEGGKYYNGLFREEEIVVPYADGSGWRFALAVMDFGYSALEAVKYAVKRDVMSGGKIKWIRTKT